MSRRRFIVRPCDNCGSVPDAPRDRQWDVVDTALGHVVANHDTRAAARKDAAEQNSIRTLGDACRSATAKNREVSP